jgi:predicted ribosomally synthesized peptide with nif11-like leader
MNGQLWRFHAMSEEQLSALIAKLQEDEGLQEKLKGAADLDAAVSLAKEAGFDVSKADFLRHQASQALELSDEDLQKVAGGLSTAANEAIGSAALFLIPIGLGMCAAFGAVAALEGK